jgi:hypothetical protein
MGLLYVCTQYIWEDAEMERGEVIARVALSGPNVTMMGISVDYLRTITRRPELHCRCS